MYYVNETAVIDKDVAIGDQTKIWHFSHLQSGCSVGKRCTIGQNVYIGENVEIGSDVKIQNNVSVYEGVTLQDGVFCGPSAVFTNDLTPRARFSKNKNYKKTLVKEGATIGANATILCGITIGRCAMIAAGAVVTKDVPDYTIFIGSPAHEAGFICECGKKLDKTLICECGKSYSITHGKLKQN